MKTLLHILAFICTIIVCISWWRIDGGSFAYPVVALCYLCAVGAINDHFKYKELYK